MSADGYSHALEERRCVVAGFAGVSPSELPLTTRLIEDLHLTDLTLFLLVAELQTRNPYFTLHDQMAIETMTVHDICHYSIVQGKEHHSADD